MRLFSLLFNRICVLTLRFTAEGQAIADVRQMRLRRNKPEILEYTSGICLPSYFQQKPKFPVCLIITGSGVARKTMEAHSALAERIRRSEEFLWNERLVGDQTEMTFVRKQQWNALDGTETLQVVMTQITADVSGEEAGARDTERTLECARDFWEQQLSWKACLASGGGVDQLAAMACRKLLLPVLLIWLAVLLINYMVFDRLYEQYGQKKMQLTVLQQQAGVRDETLRRTDRLVQELNRAGERPYARLFDRIARQIPGGLKLTLLEADPFRRVPEAGKPVETLADLIRLEGETAESGEVSLFSELLSRQDFVRSVMLTSLDRDADTGKFYFKMEVRL